MHSRLAALKARRLAATRGLVNTLSRKKHTSLNKATADHNRQYDASTNSLKPRPKKQSKKTKPLTKATITTGLVDQ
jgi:hypothetical protein